MSKRGKVLWTAGGLLLLLFFAAVSLPNLMRSRPVPEESALSSRAPSPTVSALQQSTLAEKFVLSAANATPDSPSPVQDRKIIRNAELGLTVADVRAAAEQIRRITEAGGGAIDNLEITEGGGIRVRDAGGLAYRHRDW